MVCHIQILQVHHTTCVPAVYCVFLAVVVMLLRRPMLEEISEIVADEIVHTHSMPCSC